MADSFDFIIVGGGTAGCRLAYRLANAPSAPSVLLVEAGDRPEGKYLYEHFHRYTPATLRPDLDYGYSSQPQQELNNRSIPYTRGKGLGGSSIMNFAVYLHGSREDYNRWADLVGDKSWKWEHVQKSFQAIEQYDFDHASHYPHLAMPDVKDHGRDGLVKVSLPPQLEEGIASTMEALLAHGERLNVDPNSGNPIGISIFPSSYSKDGRTTSANAHLLNPPRNLTIWTGEPVYRLQFDGSKVVGIERADGRKATSNKDVILCGGSIDTPKILLLNGIGPAKELEAHGIKVVKDLPGVGKQLRDHLMTILCVEVQDSHNKRYAFETSEELMKKAEEDWARDKTGNLALYNSALWGGFLKLPGLEDMEEFKALDPGMQEYLLRDATPTFEFIVQSVLVPPGTKLPEGSSYLSAIAFLMNEQAEGSITLRSANPEDKPVIDLAYLRHPYDKRIMREAIRATWTKVFENPEIKKHVKNRLFGPKSLSDEGIDEFMRDTVTTVWHANGTAMMGKKENALACVDKDFRVFGVDGLRVADLSICPVVTNNHTQSTAYLVGQKAADKLIAEYEL
ncbi:choline dehydrogenase [Westerdykella ornata]|uniref:Choline dehydrogenase n=1 Tax=Westerdykella ornata TaxID=318751 RepID=A0A6A6JM48_WESOR|nr:choline dehydrogenase [Westerdykella ornata]KAF2277314.1 choline dehydrogenase [Westerdykella ornata]